MDQTIETPVGKVLEASMIEIPIVTDKTARFVIGLVSDNNVLRWDFFWFTNSEGWNTFSADDSIAYSQFEAIGKIASKYGDPVEEGVSILHSINEFLKKTFSRTNNPGINNLSCFLKEKTGTIYDMWWDTIEENKKLG